jgi:hypothetical protein
MLLAEQIALALNECAGIHARRHAQHHHLPLGLRGPDHRTYHRRFTRIGTHTRTQPLILVMTLGAAVMNAGVHNMAVSSWNDLYLGRRSWIFGHSFNIGAFLTILTKSPWFVWSCLALCCFCLSRLRPLRQPRHPQLFPWRGAVSDRMLYLL